MNLSRLDRIILTEEDVKKLFSWRDENKDLIRDFKPALTEGVIEVQDYKQYFKMEGSVVHFRIFVNSLEILKFKYNPYTWIASDIRDNTKSLGITFQSGNEDLAESFNSLFMSLMAFMVNYQHDIKYIDQKTISETENKKPKKNKKQSSKNRVVKITKTIYRINGLPDKNNSAETPKIFTRHAESWKVRGHLRKLKSGKKIWIREHIKGNQQKETDPKTYKL